MIRLCVVNEQRNSRVVIETSSFYSSQQNMRGRDSSCILFARKLILKWQHYLSLMSWNFLLLFPLLPLSYVDWILPPSPCVCAPAGRWISLKMQTVQSVRMLLLAPAHGRLTPDVFILGLPVSGAGNSATPIRPCVGTWMGVRWEEAWPHVRSLLPQDQFLGRNVCTSEPGWYGAGGSVPVQISPGRGTAQAAPRADHCGSTVLTVSFITIFVWLLCSVYWV